MNLPPEIRHVIVSHFFSPGDDLWFSFRRMDELYGRRGKIRIRGSPPAVPSIALVPKLFTLLRLRLVSREWNQTATYMLAKHFWWSLKFDDTASLERAAKCCLSQGGIKMNRVKVTGLAKALMFQRKYTCDSERRRNSSNPLLYMERHSFQDEPPQRDATPEEHEILRKTLLSPNRVEGFSISFPPATTSGENDDKASCYDLRVLDEIFATVQAALKSEQFQYLVELHLEIPCTNDMQRLVDAMTIDARKRLKHLRISIMDETGQDGSSNMSNMGGSGSTGVLDGASMRQMLAPSNLQADFPNRDYQSALWDFVVSCPNLASLAIGGTHYLDLDLLDWKRLASSPGLRALSLHRVWASVASIVKLLDSSDESSPPLRLINLGDVKMHTTGGSWRELFTYLLKNCPNLAVSKIKQLTYFQDHPNFRLNHRSWENIRAVWSSDDEDWKALHRLTCHLVDKAGGKYRYPEECHILVLDEDE